MALPEEVNAAVFTNAVNADLIRKDLFAAAEKLRKGLALYPSDPNLLTLALQVYQAKSNTAPEQEAETSPVLQAGVGSWLLGDQLPIAAEPFLRRAVALDQENSIYRHLWLSALNQSKRYDDVLRSTLPRTRVGKGDVNEAAQLMSAAIGAGRFHLILNLRNKLVQIFGINKYFDECHLQALLSLKKYDQAIYKIKTMADTPERFYLGSVCHAGLGDFVTALAEIERAVESDRGNINYLCHNIAVLSCLGKHEAASLLCDELPLPTGAPESILRTAFAVYTEAGRYERAVQIGARIVEYAPDDIVFLAVYQTLLGKKIYSSLLKSSTKATPAALRAAPREPLPTKLSWWVCFTLAWRSISALVQREMKTRFGRSRLGYFWVVFEPLAHIGVMIFLIQIMNHGGSPPIGTSFAVFYFTGIIPFHMFTHTAGHMIGAVAENRPLLQIPRVKLPDIFIARAILEGITEIIVSVLLLLLFVVMGLDALPIDPLGVLAGLAILWIAAAGLGMINAAINSVFAGWERIWGAATSIIYFSSGTFYIPRSMPVWLREILVWNPVLQGIEWVRVSYFHEPHPQWLSTSYLSGLAVVLLGVGLITEKLMRRRMLDAE